MRSTEQGFVTSILYSLGFRTSLKPVISYDHDLTKGNNLNYRDLGKKVLRLKNTNHTHPSPGQIPKSKNSIPTPSSRRYRHICYIWGPLHTTTLPQTS